MNKKIKIYCVKILLSINLILGLFLGLTFKTKESDSTLNSNHLYSKKVANNNLQPNIKSLDITLDVKKQTLSYNLYFKTNKFNNKHVESYFFCANTEEGTDGVWNKIIINNSSSIVHNSHAFNTASYNQLFNYDKNLLLNWNEKVNFGVQYEQEEIYTGATKSAIELNIFRLYEYFGLDEDNIIMKVNDQKTFSQINLKLNYANTKIAIDYINLASKTNPNVEQKIYDLFPVR